RGAPARRDRDRQAVRPAGARAPMLRELERARSRPPGHGYAAGRPPRRRSGTDCAGPGIRGGGGTRLDRVASRPHARGAARTHRPGARDGRPGPLARAVHRGRTVLARELTPEGERRGIDEALEAIAAAFPDL